MPQVAVLDACVLYPAALRDVLLRCAEAGLFQPRWSQQLLDELGTALARNRPDIPAARVRRLIGLMQDAFPEARVTRVADVAIALPDSGDLHVVASAVACSADFIVTNNTKHFPEPVVGQVTSARVVSADAFLLGLLSRSQAVVLHAIYSSAAALRHPPMSEARLLELLATQVPDLVSAVRALSTEQRDAHA